MEFTIPAANGVNQIPFSSHAMNRTLSVRYHTLPTSGTVEIKARPFGRSTFISIDDAAPLPATEEKTITIGYPVAEIQISMSGVSGGDVAYITIADGE